MHSKMLAADAVDLDVETLVGQTRLLRPWHDRRRPTRSSSARATRTGLLTTQGICRHLCGSSATMSSWAGMALPRDLALFCCARTPVPIIPLRSGRGKCPSGSISVATIIAPLDEANARRRVRALAAKGVEAIAICLLWSFRNSAHERRLAEIVARGGPAAYSSPSRPSLVPILGEYERTSTTAINAYLGPVIHRYVNGLDRIDPRLRLRRADLDHGVGRRRAAGRGGGAAGRQPSDLGAGGRRARVAEARRAARLSRISSPPTWAAPASTSG